MAADVSDLSSSERMFPAMRRVCRKPLIRAQREVDRFWKLHIRHRNGDSVEKVSAFGDYGTADRGAGLDDQH